MIESNYCFLSPGPTSIRIAASAKAHFPEISLRTNGSHIPLDGIESPFSDTGLPLQEAVSEASHIFIESNCGQSLTLIDDALPHLSENATICDLLPVKAPFVEFLRERQENQVAYLGAHWLRPSPESTQLFGLVSEKEQTITDMKNQFPSLFALLEDACDSVVAFTIDQHDELVARRIQVPGLIRASKDNIDEPPSWGCTCELANHPALRYDTLIANQSRILDCLSDQKSTIQTVQNHLFSEDQAFFNELR